MDVSRKAIDNFVEFASDIFTSNFVMDAEVRRTVARMMLADSNFMDIVSEKFDFTSEVLGTSLHNTLEVAETSKHTVVLLAQLTPTQRSMLVANNPDMNLVFRDGMAQPHALAYSQRLVDTQRCKNKINYYNGVAIDIGGNYATHAMSGVQRIHSCTLRADVEEYHRQVQRDVNLSHGDYEVKSSCVVGVENCDVAASEAICIHTLPRIDPELIPHIFVQHGFKYITGVHHYDTAMDYKTQGYVPAVEMHWRRHDDNVEFYFDKDSSYDYVHSYKWLQRYSSNTFFTKPHLSFVVYYAVDKIANGMVYWSMMKQSKETLSTQLVPRQYRYTGEDEKLVLQVPIFEDKLGYTVQDPRGYALRKMECPKALFESVYKTAMANATDRPDKPISLDDVRSKTYVFNYTRSINGQNLCVEERLATKDANAIAMGIYLIVVQKQAQLRVASMEYKKVFQRIQQRWGDESVAFLLTKCASAVAFYPFIALANEMSDIVDLVALRMRATIRSQKTIASIVEQVPYFLLSPARVIMNDQVSQYVSDFEHIESQEPPQSLESMTKFYDSFKEMLTDDQAQTLRDRIEKQRLETEELKQQVKKTAHILEKDPEVELPFEETRDGWHQGMDVIDKHVKTQPAEPVEVSRDEVFKEVRMQLYEAALYNLDVTMHVTANAKTVCTATWAGTFPKEGVVASLNNTTNYAVKYYKVVENSVSDETHKDYAVFMDPITQNLVRIMDSKCDPEVIGSYLFTFDPFKIFVGKDLSRNLLAMARKIQTPHTYEFTLVDGVPGCGKTYEIINSVKPTDLIVCAVRETANDTRSAIEKKGTIDVKRVRTIDSCIINGTPRADVVYVDEGILASPGAIHFVGQQSRCRVMKVFGDSQQLSFLDFGSKLGVLRYPKIVLFEKIEYRNLTVRCPADVVVALRSVYPQSRRHLIKTTSTVRRSVKMTYEPNVDSSLYKKAVPGVTVMTFLQADKMKIASGAGFYDIKKASEVTDKKLMSGVITVHEAQGSTAPHATIIRATPFAAKLFESAQHQVVAISRHTHTLEWVSVVKDTTATFHKLLELAVNATEEQLDEVKEDTPPALLAKYESAPARGVY